MKRFLLILLCLPFLLGTSYAFTLQGITGSAYVAASTAETCPGGTGQLFYYSFESLTIADGTPPGCVIEGGPTTATPASGAELSASSPLSGTYVLSIPTTQDNLAITWANDIVKEDEGTFDGWINITTWATTNVASVFFPVVDTNNRLYLAVNAGGQVQFQHKAGGTSDRYATSSLTFSTGYYHIIAKWSRTKAGDGTHTLQVCMDTTTGTTNCGTYSGSLGTWTGTTGEVVFGNGANNTQVYSWEDVHLYGSWLP